jgi:hypothetical protein
MMVTEHVFPVEEKIVISSYHQFCRDIDLAKHIQSGPELVQGSRASQIATMNQDIRSRQRVLERQERAIGAGLLELGQMGVGDDQYSCPHKVC